jgi:hypothetical protein
MKPRVRWQDLLLAVGGIYLFLTPWLYEATSEEAASWNAWIVGAGILALAIVAIVVPRVEAVDWLQALVGLWVFVSPWVLGFTGLEEMGASAWIVGATLFFLALWAVSDVRRVLHGGPEPGGTPA